jgi:hypothetical protein
MKTEAYKKLVLSGPGTKFIDPQDPSIIHEILDDDSDALWSIVRSEDPAMHYHLEGNFSHCEEINIIERPDRLEALKEDLKALMEKHKVSIECDFSFDGNDISECAIMAIFDDGTENVLVADSMHLCDIN